MKIQSKGFEIEEKWEDSRKCTIASVTILTRIQKIEDTLQLVILKWILIKSLVKKVRAECRKTINKADTMGSYFLSLGLNSKKREQQLESGEKVQCGKPDKICDVCSRFTANLQGPSRDGVMGMTTPTSLSPVFDVFLRLSIGCMQGHWYPSQGASVQGHRGRQRQEESESGEANGGYPAQ